MVYNTSEIYVYAGIKKISEFDSHEGKGRDARIPYDEEKGQHEFCKQSSLSWRSLLKPG